MIKLTMIIIFLLLTVIIIIITNIATFVRKALINGFE